MVKNLSLIAGMLCLTSQLYAQDRIPVELKEDQFYISILDPGFTWEKKLTDKNSLTFGVGLSTYGDESSSPFDDDFGVSLNPSISADFRNFYPRKRVKKDLNPNSGNYVAVRAGYIFDSIADNIDGGTTEISQSFFMGPVWGIQRNYKSGIHLGFSIGGGFATGKNTDLKFTGLGQLRLGFAIGK